MKAPTPVPWSELPMDIVTSLLEHLSFLDFHRAKLVCSKWHLCSKLGARPKYGSPLLMLSPQPQEDGCRMYSPGENRFYKTKIDFSGFRFLANSGKWFLVADSRLALSIINVFSDKRIDLPPIESTKGGRFRLERVGDNVFKEELYDGDNGVYCRIHGYYSSSEFVKCVLWIDEKKEEYVVVWCFSTFSGRLAFCKNGEDYYREIPTKKHKISHMVLNGYMLYVLTAHDYIRVLDLSGGEEGFKELCTSDIIPMHQLDDIKISAKYNIVVTTSGEILLVHSICYKSTRVIFHLYKRDPNIDPIDRLNFTKLVEVDSLGNEALLMDLGITVPSDHTLGIEPNSIYFTRHDHDRVRRSTNFYMERVIPINICVFSLATKTIKHFPRLSNLNLEDAWWFFPS